METPSEPIALPVAATVPVPTMVARGAAEREAVRFLRHELLPSLRRAGNATLLRPVERAAETGHLDAIAHLPERTRRELLDYLDTAFPAGRRSPRAVVTLTSTVAQLPPPQAGIGHRLASPAR